jgi:hypothetical protein
MPLPTGSPTFDRDRRRLPLEGSGQGGRICQDDVWLQADQLLRERSYAIVVTAGPTKEHSHVAAVGPTQVRKRLSERRDLSLRQGIVFVARHEHADAPHPPVLLCPCRERPCHRTPETRDESPAFH